MEASVGGAILSIGLSFGATCRSACVEDAESETCQENSSKGVVVIEHASVSSTLDGLMHGSGLGVEDTRRDPTRPCADLFF
jgi:hypothetical protein